MMHIVVDGLCCAESSPTTAAVVQSVSRALAAAGDSRVTWIDRGGAIPDLGAGAVFPMTRWTGTGAAAACLLLQQLCDHLKADVFLSTGPASPTRTPSVLIAAAERPTNLTAHGQARWRAEMELAILHAREIVCLDEASWAATRALRADPEPLRLIPSSSGEDAAAVLADALVRAARARGLRRYRDFARNWAALRTMQAAVDLDLSADV